MSPAPAAALLASLAVVALAADRAWVIATIAAGLLLAALTASGARRLLYIGATLSSALSVFLLSPLVSHTGSHVLWEGPRPPVVGLHSVLAVGLATRLVPTLERDAAGFVEALRGRGIEVRGLRGRAQLLSPLLAGSLERSLNLAEAMEARGFGRPGRTRAPALPWTPLDRLAVAAALLLALGAAWL